jgi:hypothetical protein
MYRQYDLQFEDERLTGWLKVDERVRVGVYITLKDFKENPDRRWEVVRVGKIELPEPPDKRWRVGGLQ